MCSGVRLCDAISNRLLINCCLIVQIYRGMPAGLEASRSRGVDVDKLTLRLGGARPGPRGARRKRGVAASKREEQQLKGTNRRAGESKGHGIARQASLGKVDSID